MTKSVEARLGEIEKRVERLEDAIFRSRKQPTKAEEAGDIDTATLTYVKDLGSTLDRCLAILDNLFAKDSRHAGLTSDEFAVLLKDRYGLPVQLSTISSQLYKATGCYVARQRIEGPPVKYRYQILSEGQEYIRKRIEQLQGRKNAR